MKLVNLKTMKSKNLSEYEAFKLINETPEEDKLKPGKHELLRTKEFILYCLNKRTKMRLKPYVRRLAALLSKQTGEPVRLNEKNYTIIAGGVKYILADKVDGLEELEYHRAKGGEVICLKKNAFCKYIQLDYKSLRDYYSNTFTFPEWFVPLIKMRSFRVSLVKGGNFIFNSRRYTNTSKWSSLDKFRFDFAGHDVSKAFFTLARNLDSLLDKKGTARILNNLIFLSFDLDGSCGEPEHLINDCGICVNCFENAMEKLEKAKELLKDVPEFKNGVRAIFSGGKGTHISSLPSPIEVSEERYLQIQNILNANERLVDDFSYERNGKLCYDTHRIFRLPFSCDAGSACIVAPLEEGFKRINVDDKIIQP